MKTYTTSKGSVVTINGLALTITMPNGRRIELTSCKTIAVPAGMAIPSGLRAADYRLCCGQPVDVATADWIDANFASELPARDEAAVAAEADRARKERAYDNLHNEGGDGYNPYREGDTRDTARGYRDLARTIAAEGGDR